MARHFALLEAAVSCGSPTRGTEFAYDALVGAGFGLARGKAADLIAAGKVSLDGLPCTKPDKPVPEGGKISARGYGKVILKEISGRTKKDRISIVLEKYV